MADKRFIANTKIHDKEIAQWLSDYFGRPVTLKTCKANKIGAGQGCTASVFRLELEYDGEQDSLPKSAVLKVPSRAAVKESYKKLITDEDADVDEEVESHIASHAIECMTYKILGKHSPLPLPIIYAARPFENEKVGAILMEDLDEKAATIGDQTCTLPLDKMYEVADTLAEFHAWCITTNYDWKRHFDPPYCDHRKQAYHDKEFAIMKKCFERAKRNYPNVFDKMDMRKARKIFGNGHIFPILEKHREIVPDVVVHGDLYANNLMFAKATDDSGHDAIGSKIVAIIDWPMAHRGCGIKDFASLMAFSVDHTTRRDHTRDIMRRYYNRLVKNAGADTILASFEDLMQVYDDQFVLAGMCFVFMLDWWQKLFAGEGDDEDRTKKQALFERSVHVYEDLLPLIEKCDV